MDIKLKTPLTKEKVQKLKCGDRVLLSGEIYTARDAAHKRMIEAIKKGEGLPVNIENSIIYYAGPAPAKPGCTIGSCGPTTSCRMDAYAPKLIEMGLTGMIGKGVRSNNVIEAMKKHKSVYFGAVGGAGALIAECIKTAETIAYHDLGTEAIRRLTVEDMPVVVAIDSTGKSLFKSI